MSISFFPSGDTKTALNIHFTNLTSGILNFPTGNLRKSLFHPFCKVTCIGRREAAFSFINGISFDRSLWVFFQTGGSSSLLFCMVRNASLNYLKQKVLVDKFPIEYIENIDGEERLYSLDFALSADEETLYEELRRQIQEALSVLPERSREVFLLSRFNGLKNKEIASKLGISTTAVEKHISKSLKRISSYLKDNVNYNDYIIIISIFLFTK